eukprot:603656-Pyramimonas_sp.AAC.1
MALAIAAESFCARRNVEADSEGAMQHRGWPVETEVPDVPTTPMGWKAECEDLSAWAATAARAADWAHLRAAGRQPSERER